MKNLQIMQMAKLPSHNADALRNVHGIKLGEKLFEAESDDVYTSVTLDYGQSRSGKPYAHLTVSMRKAHEPVPQPVRNFNHLQKAIAYALECVYHPESVKPKLHQEL